jgi:hypothetical protein
MFSSILRALSGDPRTGREQLSPGDALLQKFIEGCGREGHSSAVQVLNDFLMGAGCDPKTVVTATTNFSDAIYRADLYKIGKFRESLAELVTADGDKVSAVVRARKVAELSVLIERLSPCISAAGGKFLSFMSGDCLLAKGLAEATGQVALGSDINPSPDPVAKIHLAWIESSRLPYCDGVTAVGVSDRHLSWLEEPEQWVKELCRVSSERILIVENVIPAKYIGNEQHQQQLSLRAAFQSMLEDSWGRGRDNFCHGNYRRVEEWEKVFAGCKWKLEKVERLPLPSLAHVLEPTLLVFSNTR